MHEERFASNNNTKLQTHWVQHKAHISTAITAKKSSHLMFILWVVKRKNGSRTRELARSSFSQSSLAFMLVEEENRE